MAETSTQGGNGKQGQGPLGFADCLKTAVSIELAVDHQKYQGSIEKTIPGKAILFKIFHLKQELLNIPDGYEGVRILAHCENNRLRIYQTKVIKKKLPRFLLSFPGIEVEQKNRAHMRARTNIPTAITVLRRAYGLLPHEKKGAGKIENMSEGGCSISTHVPLETKDTVSFFLSLKNGNSSISLDLHGNVMSIEKVENESVRAGIKFVDLQQKTEQLIMLFMARRTAPQMAG